MRSSNAHMQAHMQAQCAIDTNQLNISSVTQISFTEITEM